MLIKLKVGPQLRRRHFIIRVGFLIKEPLLPLRGLFRNGKTAIMQKVAETLSSVEAPFRRKFLLWTRNPSMREYHGSGWI